MHSQVASCQRCRPTEYRPWHPRRFSHKTEGCVRLLRSVKLLERAVVKFCSAADVPDPHTGRRVVSGAAGRRGHTRAH